MATDFNIVVDVKAPPERVWDVLVDVERWPEWTSTMTSVRRLENEPLAAGSRVRVRQPRLAPAIWQVTEFDRNTNFTWVSRSPGVRVEAEHRVTPDGPGSRVNLSVRFYGLLGPLLAQLLRNLTERYIATEAHRLRNRCQD